MQENLCKISSCSGQNLLTDDSDQGIQLLFDGIAAEGDPERTVNDVGISLHGVQYMAPVTFGAGAAGADTNAVILQNVDGILVGTPGMPRFRMWGAA